MISSVLDFIEGPGPVSWVQETFGPDAYLFFDLATLLGEPVAVAVAVALLLWGRGRTAAYGLLALVVLVTAVNAELKALFDMPRPADPAIIIYHEASRSAFPSGHSATAGALWGGLMAFGRTPPPLALGAVALVMLSRLYLGVHFLGDVLVGAALGLALASLATHLWPRLVAWFMARPAWLIPALATATVPVALVVASASPYSWALFGTVLGATLGELAEMRWVRFRPGRVPWRLQLRRVLVGALGLALIAGAGFLIDVGPPMSRVIVFGLATFWLTFGAPAVFVRQGLGARSAADQPPPAMGATPRQRTRQGPGVMPPVAS